MLCSKCKLCLQETSRHYGVYLSETNSESREWNAIHLWCGNYQKSCITIDVLVSFLTTSSQRKRKPHAYMVLVYTYTNNNNKQIINNNKVHTTLL